MSILKLIQKFQDNIDGKRYLFVKRAKAGRIVSLTGFRRKLHVGFCLTILTSIDDINFTDLNHLFLIQVGIDMSTFIYVAV